MKRFFSVLLAVLLASPAISSAVTRSTTASYTTGGITLNLAEPTGSIYRPGESVTFIFKTQKDAYVIIFDIDTEGFIHLLYPEEGRLREKAIAGREYLLPADVSASFIVSGSTGMELVFGLAVPERSSINEEELAFLAENEYLPSEKQFKIDGDPLLAANMIASELVSGISHLDGISLAYTHFFINEQVEYPRYLCAECHDKGPSPYTQSCPEYEFTSNLEKTENLTYPLRRGFDVVLVAGDASDAEKDDEQDSATTKVYIAFYPYDSHVYVPRTSYSYYAYDPWYWTPLWYDPWGYWDPFYSGSFGSSFYFSWGWNWGSWGWSYQYPYSYWYQYPTWYSDYYPHHRYIYRPLRPARHRYKTNLYAATTYNSRRNPDLRISSIRYKDKKEIAEKRHNRDKLRKYRSSKTTYKSTLKPKDSYRKEVVKSRQRSHFKRNKSHVYNNRSKKVKLESRLKRSKTDKKPKARSYRGRGKYKKKYNSEIKKPSSRRKPQRVYKRNTKKRNAASPKKSSSRVYKKSSPRKSSKAVKPSRERSREKPSSSSGSHGKSSSRHKKSRIK